MAENTSKTYWMLHTYFICLVFVAFRLSFGQFPINRFFFWTLFRTFSDIIKTAGYVMRVRYLLLKHNFNQYQFKCKEMRFGKPQTHTWLRSYEFSYIRQLGHSIHHNFLCIFFWFRWSFIQSCFEETLF